MSCSVTRGISNARRAVVANEGAAAACGANRTGGGANRTGAQGGRTVNCAAHGVPMLPMRKHGRQPMRACKADARPECKRACVCVRVCV